MTSKIALFAASVGMMVAGMAALAAGPASTNPADERAGGRWGCVGAEPVVGVCLDSPLETLTFDLF